MPLTVPATPLAARAAGYRLSTAELLYHMPDYPELLQTFVWQHYDIAPRFPELNKFLEYWRENIEAELHSVRVMRQDLGAPPCDGMRHADHWLTLH